MNRIVVAVACLLAATSTEAAEVGAIQGAAHRSPMAGDRVETEGVVTLVRGNGFFLQGAPDGDDATSDAIFVFTSALPAVAVGDAVRVEGRVVEFTPPNRPEQLPLTEIAEPEVVALGEGATPPDPVMLGPDGRMPPTEVIDDDELTAFEPASDAIDFYESLEGMRVAVEDAIALDPVSRFGEVWAVIAGGSGATGFNGRDAIVMRPGDFNPERVLLDLELVAAPASIEAGTMIGDLVGILDYGFGGYRIEVTGLGQETPAARTAGLTIGSYNVENLDPVVEDRALVGGDAEVDDDVGTGKFAAIAAQIVGALAAPAIVALQEIQDNDGAERTPVVAADVTLRELADAIVAAGGPRYSFLDLPPQRDADGGQPGGNIRVAYLFDPTRARLAPASPRRIVDPDTADGDAFADTRKPLLAGFDTAAGPVTLINLHLSSRGGGDPAFGSVQPPAIAADDARRAQAAVVAREVDALLASDPSAKIVVLGDFNAFYFEPTLTELEGADRLFNLHRGLPELARYTYVFEGQGQALDHALVSAAAREGATLAIRHVNAGRIAQASDHDPYVVALAPAEGAEPSRSRALGDAPAPPAGLVGEPLRSWLRANWYNGRHATLGYDDARRAMYGRIDVQDDGRVRGVYSGFSQPAAEVTFLDPINAEHTVPQSWFGAAEPMRSDIHHLFPTHKEVNAARGSKPFGEVTDTQANRWYAVDGAGGLLMQTGIPTDTPDRFSEDDQDEFEPPEAQKGDTARAIFYFYTMYPGSGRPIERIAADGLPVLHDWHTADPPDARERERNTRVEAEQGNRNPFVDHPEIACRAWELPC